MKEKPILFSAPMVRAILEGHKTMTRRIVKPQPPERLWPIWAQFPRQEAGMRYAVGDRLWVKEAIEASDLWDGQLRTRYKADGAWVWDLDNPCLWCWKRNSLPSMFLPRGMSRITLEVTSHRVERVQEITEEAAIAEGMQEPTLCDLGGMLRQAAWSERQVFSRLWNHLHGKDAWDRNEWVEVVGFRRIA